MDKTEWSTVGVPVCGALVIPDLNDPWSQVTSHASGPGSFVDFGLNRYKG